MRNLHLLLTCFASFSMVFSLAQTKTLGVLAGQGGTNQALTQNTTPGILIGQDETNKVITTAVPFLGITPDSRAAALGDAGVATSPDANSAYWNAAKLAFIDKGYGGSLSYSPWLSKIINDMKLVYLTGFYKISRKRTFAASLKYFDLGKVDFRTITNDPNGTYNPRDLSFGLTYSQLLTEHFSIGGTLSYIYSNLTGAGVDAKPGSSVAVDLGVYYTRPFVSSNATLSLGASLSNIGAKISYTDANSKDFLPGNIRIGGAFKKELDPFNSLTFILDFNKLLVPSPYPGSKSQPLLTGVFESFTDARGGFKEELHEITTSIGIEYWYKQTFSGRFGYFYEAPDKGNRNYITGGIGLRMDQFGLDAAYMVPVNKQNNALAETLRFSLMMLIPTKDSQDEDAVKD
jgi:hypothetical protein